MPRALGRGQAGQDRRVALLGQEGGRRRGPSGLHPPERLPSRHPGRQVGDDVGHEGGGDAGLDLPVRPVLEGGPRRGHRRGGVRHVVGHHLVGVDAATVADRGTGPVDEVLGQIGRVCGGGEQGWVDVVTGRDPNGSRRAPFWGAAAQALRPMTVTSGGRTTGSSPGSTPVSDSR